VHGLSAPCSVLPAAAVCFLDPPPSRRTIAPFLLNMRGPCHSSRRCSFLPADGAAFAALIGDGSGYPAPSRVRLTGVAVERDPRRHGGRARQAVPGAARVGEAAPLSRAWRYAPPHGVFARARGSLELPAPLGRFRPAQGLGSEPLSGMARAPPGPVLLCWPRFAGLPPPGRGWFALRGAPRSCGASSDMPCPRLAGSRASLLDFRLRDRWRPALAPLPFGFLGPTLREWGSRAAGLAPLSRGWRFPLDASASFVLRPPPDGPPLGSRWECAPLAALVESAVRRRVLACRTPGSHGWWQRVSRGPFFPLGRRLARLAARFPPPPAFDAPMCWVVYWLGVSVSRRRWRPPDATALLAWPRPSS